jgi:hypothetical protein
VVTGWVLVTVPVLGAGVVLLAIRLPHLAEVAWQSAVAQAASLSAAIQVGDPVLGAMSAIQLAVLSVPCVGALVIVLRLMRLDWARTKRSRTRRSTPEASVPAASMPCSCRPG